MLLTPFLDIVMAKQSHDNDIGEKVGPYVLQALVKVAPHRLNLTVLTRQNVKNEVPSTSGLYLLLFETLTGYEVFYVGQASKLKQRLLEHLGLREKNSCIKKYLHDYNCYYHCIELRSRQFLSTFECELIRTYSPPCNLTDH